MPRTLNANLLAALDARNFAKPIIRGWFGTDGAHEVQATVLKYTKTSTTISADVYGVNLEGIGYNSFTIERGLEINGIEYTIFSCHFFITAWNRIEKIFHIQGQLFDEREYTSAGDTTYGDAITTWLLTCTPGGFTPTFQNPLASWLSYQFLATGKNISLNRNTQFPPLLKQKYLGFIADYQDSTPIIFSTEDTFNRTTDWTISITDKDTYDESFVFKRFRWIDEVGTYHTSSATGSVHNLGYLESTASPPTARPAPFGSLAGQMYGEYIKVTLPFHLKYLTGDKVNFHSFTGYEGILDVTEILDPEAEIAWRIELTPLAYLTNTDGGNMPATVERISNYTPINATGFNGTLDSTINNLQAFANKVDDLVIGNMLKSTYDTDNDGTVDNAELLQGYAASAFAVAAKGVTNGDSHDHNGGDGAQIAHGNLSGISPASSTHVTNGDSHDHNGGDGGTIAYSSLSTRPVAETNANDIYQIAASPGGTSAWTGTINGAPAGTSVTLTTSTGTKASMKPAATTQLAKMRLYNLTRGTSALISDFNTATNVCTLTANAPAAWANGDSMTIASQTLSGGGLAWVDLEITSGPTSKSYIFMKFQINSATVGDAFRIHPLDASHSASKYDAVNALVASQTVNGSGLIKIVTNVFCIAWTGTPAAIVIREAGYLE